MRQHSNPVVLFGKFLWNCLDTTRRVLANLFFLLIIIILVALFMRLPTQQEMPLKYNVLKLDLEGIIVEETRLNQALAQAYSDFSDTPKETLLRDIVHVIKQAKQDPNVKAMVLDLDKLARTSLTKLLVIGRALDDFKTANKPLYAYGDYFTQRHYLIASHADYIWLNSAGFVSIDGLGIYTSYYHSALEKAKVKPYIFRVGQYKSAVEPFMRDDMSPESKEAHSALLTDLWAIYQQKVAENRNMPAELLAPPAPQLVARLKQVDGDSTRYALDYGFVDALGSRGKIQDELKQKIMQATNGEEPAFIDFDRYLFKMGSSKKSLHAPSVAVITAEGEIRSGHQPAGVIGDVDINKLFESAIKDENIKAVVLRIDSPGGSAFASEQIRQKMLEVIEAGKPVVVSMGTMAASGGYWIAANAQKIFAEPSSLTGSIGVFSALFSVQETLSTFGIHNDGVGTTSYAAWDINRDLPQPLAEILQLSVEHSYQQFLNVVANGRAMLPNEVDYIAQGRVWSGQAALKIGLVDALGGFEEAIAQAAELASISDQFEVEYLRHQLQPHEQLLSALLTKMPLSLVTPLLKTATTRLRAAISNH